MTTPTPNPDFIYKIASAENFAAAKAAGTYTGMPIDAQDGFIHFSTAAQLAETLSLHFKGQTGLVLFSVRSAEIGAKLVWEASRGGNLFPHVYGPFPMAAVAWQGTVDVGPDGSVALPAEVI
jgi:uncharacterized protein (DUF952 family)